MHFIKMHGIGNDYIYFNCLERGLKNPEAAARKLTDRHCSIGGDGIVLLLPSDKADFRMRMFNADGSEGKMCGNASRCIGKYVYDLGLTEKTTVTLETLAGIRTLHLKAENGEVSSVSVDMGKAEFSACKVPVRSELPEVINHPFTVDDMEWRITCLSVGNPHCVVFCENPDLLDLKQIGPMFENHPFFPERVNTEFVRVESRESLSMRVWERGSGETLACGTGACAAAAAAVHCGLCYAEKPILVHLRGGNLQITVNRDNSLIMEGTAEFSFFGEIHSVQYE